jgi:hypothetical protein
MEQPCHKCGQSIEEGVPFCPHCSAPQIRVVIAEPPAAPEFGNEAPRANQLESAVPRPEPMVSLASPTALIRWREGLFAAATAGLLAGLGMTLIGLFGLWMIAAGFMSVFFYRRRTRGDLLRPGAGARLGAVSGILGYSLFCLMTVPTGFFRVMISEMLQRYAQRADPQVRALTESWLEVLKTPSGVIVWLVSLFLFMVIASAIGGALGGVLLGRKARM